MTNVSTHQLARAILTKPELPITSVIGQLTGDYNLFDGPVAERYVAWLSKYFELCGVESRYLQILSDSKSSSLMLFQGESQAEEYILANGSSLSDGHSARKMACMIARLKLADCMIQRTDENCRWLEGNHGFSLPRKKLQFEGDVVAGTIGRLNHQSLTSLSQITETVVPNIASRPLFYYLRSLISELDIPASINEKGDVILHHRPVNTIKHSVSKDRSDADKRCRVFVKTLLNYVETYRKYCPLTDEQLEVRKGKFKVRKAMRLARQVSWNRLIEKLREDPSGLITLHVMRA
jgi:hypothetical protein